MDIMEHFHMAQNAKANPQNTISFEKARFSVLTPFCIRMEYSESQMFEDRPTQTFFHRDLGSVEYRTTIEGNTLTLDTGELVLRYRDTPIGFDRNTLSVQVKSTEKTWYYSYFDRDNLKGTSRTLDGGRGPIPLEEGLMSRLGFYCLNDTERLPIPENGIPAPRDAQGKYQDLYLFGYGLDYRRCLQDYFQMTGQMPMLPRFAFGNWWSRFWEYSEQELKELIITFEDHEIPFSVCIIDMDWHLVENDYHLGWTGYTFNRELFPDHPAFFKWLHKRGLYTSLNLHPSEGVAPHEEQYTDFCSAMGLNPEDRGIIPFDITDPRFIRAYFEVLHHPYEKEGVDFWWMDWQQGTKTKIEGLDPLWMLNHLHYLDAGREENKRPFFFSRWCGLGGHRYQIGFSGDAMVTWDMLNFEPYFTATAANVGNFFWSHDIGGHYSGMHDPELYVRWVQFGVFSPILRLHSCKNPLQERRPWMYEGAYGQALADSLRLRHRLIPYVYTMAYLAHKEALPLMQPMYYVNPEKDEAYACANQYWFGTQLIVAPVTEPLDPNMHTARKSVWLPEGDFYDFQTGEHYSGGRFVAYYAELHETPVFAKSGAIVPMDAAPKRTGTDIPQALEIFFFPGTGSFALFEDDGISQQFENGHYAITIMESDITDGKGKIVLYSKGDLTCLPNTRDFRLVIKGVEKPEAVSFTMDGKERDYQEDYDSTNGTLTIAAGCVPSGARIELQFAAASYQRNLAADRLQRQIRKWNARNDDVWSVLSNLEEIIKEPSSLRSFAPNMPQLQQSCVMETLRKVDLNNTAG